MQPLSKTRRRAYLYALTLLFIVLIPIVTLYASGYRYKSGFGLVQTGGIYISIPYSGATVAMDGKTIGQTGFLERSFFIDNLVPGSYVITTMRSGFLPWSRVIVVEQRLVTDASVLLLPEHAQATRIVLESSDVGTSSISVSSATLASYRAAFTLLAASTSISSVAGEAVHVENGNVYIRWSDEAALPPSTFCGRPSYCAKEIPLEQGQPTSLGAVFYAGGVVYSTREGGVFLSEVDARPTAVVSSLYPHAGADFRIVNGELIVKDGTSYYLISL